MLIKVAADNNIDGSLLIIFNNDRQMSNLNSRFKRKNRPTDVLAFNLADIKMKNYIEGEVYIDLQIAARQARDYKVDYLEEVVRLCLHGLLHLIGYDDLKTTDKNKMWKLQESYINKFLKRIPDGTKRRR
ncbi:MAG: rRNA maturation RNase YbeY [candidate division Zixibacteria bacterium]|nr:rRNA maturation RNase YbeY [candidate division Zixibacteria bacterium]